MEDSNEKCFGKTSSSLLEDFRFASYSVITNLKLVSAWSDGSRFFNLKRYFTPVLTSFKVRDSYSTPSSQSSYILSLPFAFELLYPLSSSF